nr:hypothetical protein OG409_10245 [Streptomyces sp. NBC_00974]
MSGIVVVYELDQAGSVTGVHAAPHAPGADSGRGPRTMCGKDTFAMEPAARQPSGHPGSSWCPPEHADRQCPGCAAVVDED